MGLSSIVFKDEIINALIGFRILTGNNYMCSFYRQGKAAYFEILQGSYKF